VRAIPRDKTIQSGEEEYDFALARGLDPWEFSSSGVKDLAQMKNRVLLSISESLFPKPFATYAPSSDYYNVFC
jgi:hypothetical protein